MDNIDTFIEVCLNSKLGIIHGLVVLISYICVPLESVCTGGRWRLWSSKERVQGLGHVTGGSHRPSHSPHAQHHPGRHSGWISCKKHERHLKHWLSPSFLKTRTHSPHGLFSHTYCTFFVRAHFLFHFFFFSVHAAENSGPRWECGVGGLWVLVDLGGATSL